MKHVVTKPLHHAYIVEGLFSTIKQPLVDHLESIFLTSFTGHPNVVVLEYDKVSVEDARALKDMHDVGIKIFIVGLNFISREAQNALLKVLEEPIAHTHFFFVVPSLHTILPTLKSRVRIVTRREHGIEAEMLWDPELFYSASLSKRFEMIKHIVDDIKDGERGKIEAIQFCEALTEYARKNNASYVTLETLLKARMYLFDHASSVKVVLDTLAIVL